MEKLYIYMCELFIYQNPIKVQHVKFIMDVSPRHCIEAPVVLILCKAIQIDYQSETTSTKEHASEINVNWTTRHDTVTEFTFML